MKKLSLILGLLFIVTSGFAQSTAGKFYTGAGTKQITEIKCDDISDIQVKVPIPSNVAEYDNFTIKILLSHLDVVARVSYDKNKIKAKLVGKKEVLLTVISTNGPSDFKFGDGPIDMKDFCEYPRQRLLDKITAKVWGTGYKILKYYTETRWDDYRSAYITEDVPVWDEGEKYDECSMTIYQKPLSDGIQDEKGVFSIKLVNPDKSDYRKMSSARHGFDGSLVVEDNSLSFPVIMYFLYFKADKQTVKDDLMKMFSSKTIRSCDYDWPYYYADGDVEPDNRGKYNNEKQKDFVPVTLEGKEFLSLSYYQKACYQSGGGSGYKLLPGMLLDFYIIESSPYTLVVCGVVSDELKEKSVSYSQPGIFIKDDLFKYRLKPEDMAKAQEIFKATVGSIKFTK